MDVTVDTDHLRFAGVLDGRCAPRVRDLVYDSVAGSSGPVVLDLTDVELVDLTVVRMLAVASRQAERRGTRLVLRGCGSAVRRMVQLSGCGRWLRLEGSVGAPTRR